MFEARTVVIVTHPGGSCTLQTWWSRLADVRQVFFAFFLYLIVAYNVLKSIGVILMLNKVDTLMQRGVRDMRRTLILLIMYAV